MKIGIVTSFPEAGAAKSAIAYYSQTILDPLRASGDEYVVFADAAPAVTLGTRERYAENVTVCRCWRFGYFAAFEILQALMRERVDVLHVEYDVYLYGGVIAAVVLPLVLRLVRRLRGTRIVVTLHGVVSQRVVTREMLRENGFVLPYSRIGRLGFRTIYALFAWASDRIVVLEVKLAEILQYEYGVKPEKIAHCPHPLMHEGPRPPMREARSRCGIGDDNLVLFFGYASYYKGLDILLDAFALARTRVPNLGLQIVAGRHPRLRGNARYESFYEGLQAKARAVGTEMHEFMAETQLHDYLASADVVVLPYTATYGASGALNTVFGARKPVLVSTFAAFEGALDCQQFAPTPQACADAIVAFFGDNRSRIEQRLDEIAASRNVNVIAQNIAAIRRGTVVRETAPQTLDLTEFADGALQRAKRQ